MHYSKAKQIITMIFYCWIVYFLASISYIAIQGDKLGNDDDEIENYNIDRSMGNLTYTPNIYGGVLDVPDCTDCQEIDVERFAHDVVHGRPYPEFRIVNGDATLPGKWPWQGKLRTNIL